MQDPTAGTIESVLIVTLLVGLLLSLFILVLPRRYALLPLILGACFIPVAGKLTIAGMNLSVLRLITACGLARIAARGEFKGLGWFRIDSLIVLWAAIRVVAFFLLWQSSAALVNGLGYAFDAIGLYLICRALMRDKDDLIRVIKWFALALLPVAALMCIEKVKVHDPFSIFGGVPVVPTIREGIVRAQGPFGHAILAGTFGAVWLPVFIGLWLQGNRYRKHATIGILACTLITLTSGSSGPIGSYLAGVVGLTLWCIRRHMQAMRWIIVGGIVSLHLVMHDPVWFVFARIDVLSGSTGWHRANLIDRAVSNFGDWWLVGCKDVARWGVWAGDTTNQFIVEGVRGGLITVLLFAWIFVVGFSYVGLTVKASRCQSRKFQVLTWAIGAGLFSHLISYMGVSYFDQNVFNWYLLLAMIVVLFRARNAHSLVEKSQPEQQGVSLPLAQSVLLTDSGQGW